MPIDRKGRADKAALGDSVRTEFGKTRALARRLCQEYFRETRKDLDTLCESSRECARSIATRLPQGSTVGPRTPFHAEWTRSIQCSNQRPRSTCLTSKTAVLSRCMSTRSATDMAD